MKNIKKYLLVLAAGSILTSCSISGPLMVTNNPIGSKRGVAERTIWFNITFGHTDLGVATAAKNGGITKIATVDWKVTSKLFRSTYSTVVTGE